MTAPIHIVCIGSELLNGRTLNTNLRYLGEVMTAAGLRISRESCVDDVPAAIVETLRQARAAGECVVTIGGLGPTDDDLTIESVAQFLERPLTRDQAQYDRVAEIYRRRGREPGFAAEKMAAVPEGAVALPNPNGTAQGLWCKHPLGDVILLPGPPNECHPMVRDHVLPALAPPPNDRPATCVATVYGIPESQIQTALSESLDLSAVTLAFRLDFGCCELRFSGTAAQRPHLERLRDQAATLFPNNAVAAATPLALRVVELVRQRGGTLAAAESCTGGMIAAAITDFPGVSDVFLGSAVTYANSAKQALTHVPARTLDTHGAVSPQTAAAMAAGAAQTFAATCTVAVSGVAGPGGGSPEKPVGLVEFATSVDGVVESVTRHFHGDRATVRSRAAATALNLLRQRLQTPDT